jgi:hypothetical protein
MIKPTKYPYNPEEMAELFGEAVNQGRNGKQDTLVSGDNIKTINGASVLGSGDLTVSGSGASWGNITGTLSSQSDLQTALNAKQNTLVSGTSIKTVNGNSLLGSGNVTTNPRTLASINGSNLTGTANQISAFYRIAGGTLVANNTIYIKGLLNKTAGSANSQPRFYINTSNSLSGATLLGAGQAMGTSVYFQRFERNIFFDGTNLNGYNMAISAANDYTSSAITLTAFNPANDYYLIFAVQNSSTTPDNLGWKRVIVQIYD